MTHWMHDVSMKYKDIQGLRFGQWMVERRAYVKPGKTHWLCVCSCGYESFVLSSHLIGGKSTKCKRCHNRLAVAKRPLKHGNAQRSGMSKEYRIWSGMKTRCMNPNSDGFEHYGNKGVHVCDRWITSFEDFFNDMGKCPDGMTLDRIDNNLGYSKSNCRWATHQQQAVNRSIVKKFDYTGSEYCIAELSRLWNVPETTLRRKIKLLGWPLSEYPQHN